jgi:folate-binding protein YgfZ
MDVSMSHSFSVAHRPYLVVHDITTECALKPQPHGLFELEHYGALKLTGEKQRAFLQGQLTADIQKVTPNYYQPAALCNLKGRILALMDVIDLGEEQLLLVLPKDLLEQTAHSLTKAALFSGITIQVTDAYAFFGFSQQHPADLCPEGLTLPSTPYEVTYKNSSYCYALTEKDTIIIVEKESSHAFTAPFIINQRYHGSLAWHIKQLSQGRASIYPLSRGLFLPQRLNLDALGYISYNKGCYKGQEIIARTHYLGKEKYALTQWINPYISDLKPGTLIQDATQKQSLGEIIDYAPLNNHHMIIIASLRIDAPTTIWIEGQDTPHERSALFD